MAGSLNPNQSAAGATALAAVGPLLQPHSTRLRLRPGASSQLRPRSRLCPGTLPQFHPTKPRSSPMAESGPSHSWSHGAGCLQEPCIGSTDEAATAAGSLGQVKPRSRPPRGALLSAPLGEAAATAERPGPDLVAPGAAALAAFRKRAQAPLDEAETTAGSLNPDQAAAGAIVLAAYGNSAPAPLDEAAATAGSLGPDQATGEVTIPAATGNLTPALLDEAKAIAESMSPDQATARAATPAASKSSASALLDEAAAMGGEPWSDRATARAVVPAASRSPA
ncbi:hypothetical protein CLV40_12354 [Actinokineospora auranticolor]|uniref:Uncharacterized protein n=1 Tax=Actinokineospora auranticolor TaxID=155976 RepID=A0A2S6GFE3_9PSEU|nr:hypothetical protein CLV40_12354 [Actinokineospora auranticolor]